MAAYGPSGPTTFSSGYPIATGTVLGTGMPNAGVGGDSFRHGIRYWNDVTGANYFYSRLKSTFPDLLSNRVNAATAALDWSHGRIGQDKIIARYQNNAATAGLIGLANTSQIAAIENLDIAAAAIFRSPGQAATTTTDLAGYSRSLGRAVPYCGLTVYTDGRQPHDRVDFWLPSTVYKVMLHETRFKDFNGSKIDHVKDGDGRPVKAIEFFIEEAFDWFQSAPGKAFYIDNLSVPTTYLS
jgi:hypothetical protein